MKKQYNSKQTNFSLFESPQETLAKLEAVSSPPLVAEQPKIKDACPRCGSRSLKTVRSWEHDNHTHYCAGGCLSADRTEAFYFTSAVETFVEAAEREEARKVVAETPAQKIVREAFAAVEEVIAETPAIQEMDSVLEQVEAAVQVIEGEQPTDLFGNPIEKKQAGALAERFIVPPFSVLDARQGYWTKRKAEWVAMGITSESGRSENWSAFSDLCRENGGAKIKSNIHNLSQVALAESQGRLDKFRNKVSRKGVLHTSESGRIDGEEFDGGDCWVGSGTSIFDPVLCELAYAWFAPQGGKILDPFAGGSVRGIVAEKLGCHYTGIELREEQIAANQVQAKKIGVTPNWILGDSSRIDKLIPVPPYEEMFDMIFACPPYYDLEEYSESAEDGSAKQTYAEFLVWYENIFKLCVKRLKWNRFAVIVVGEIRDDDGWYRNFVGDTVSVMQRCGLRYYNEAILVTAVGSLPLRVNTQFGGYRKLGKTHQNVLVFYNGTNPDQINEKFGKLL